MKLNSENCLEPQTGPQQAAANGEDLVRRFVRLPLDKQRSFIRKLAEQGRTFAQLPIPAQLCGGDDIPLSAAQQGLWILAQLDPSNAAYHIAGGVCITGDVAPERVRQAFAALAERHDALRSVFYARDGQPRQRLVSGLLPAWDYRDLSAWPPAEAQAQAGQLAEQAARAPFDLANGPLWRLLLVKLADAGRHSRYELNLTLHHLIADGWSLNWLLAEFAELYAGLGADRPAQLPALPIRHADFACWQRHWLAAGEAERQLAYWLQQLGGEQPQIVLPYDRPRPAEPSQRGGRVGFALSEALGGQLAERAKQQGATPFMLLLAAFNVWLYRISGQTDLRVGLPLANRNRPETQGLIGYLVNTVVLRSRLNGRTTFLELLQQVKHSLLQAQAHPDLPFEQLVDALQPERRLGQNPLFQILINHQQTDLSLLQAGSDWQIDSLERDNGAAQFDLSLDTWQRGPHSFGGFFTYACDLFDAETVQRLAGQLQNLLTQLLAQPHAPIAAHAILSAAESEQFQTWNLWPRCYDGGVPVQELIRRQAEAWPQAIALIAGEQSLRYAELERDANRLAHYLVQVGLGRESRVAVLLARGVEAIVAMLAVLKAGAAFVPLDPEQPAQRLADVIADAGASRVIVRGEPRHTLAGAPLLDLAAVDLTVYSDRPPAVAIHPDQLAYLILTSGSSGKPKGVAVAHGALARHCLAIGERYAMQRDDVALHFAAFTFDAAMEQWLVPLMHGCRLLLREQMWSADQAYQALIQHRVSWFEMPPAYLLEIARWAEPRGLHLPLRACSVGGEAVSREGLAQIRHLVGDAPILNGYGPTETLITPLVWTALPDSVCDSVYAPIGTGVGERSLYLLDQDLNRLPLGAVGELYIGGPCLARGYHGRPDLSAERFLPDPFAADGSRMYRSGDLARFRADGEVEYLGRADQQIKLRGYRIEPGEIEAELRRLPGVADAHVGLFDDQGRAYLAAYLEPGPAPADIGIGLNVAGVKAALAERLPEYMLPASIQVVERLPRLSSGKLNRHALPKPERTNDEASRAPQTPAERDLAAIWQAVLGVERIGADDNFFEAGGDSIMAIRLVSRARQAGWQLSPKDLFLHQTVAQLAAHAGTCAPQAAQAELEAGGDAPLTPIQVQFFTQDMPNRAHWNLSLLLRPKHRLDQLRVGAAVRGLLAHHDSLRLRYSLGPDGWRQFYAESADGECWEQLAAADAAQVSEIARRLQRSLDLANGPLVKVALIAVADGSQRLLLVAHHLLVDGVSWRILLEDLQALYAGASSLPAKTASFGRWGERLKAYAASPELAQQKTYWQTLLRGVPEPPRDFPVAEAKFAEAQTVSLEIDAESTRQLLTTAPAAYRAGVNDLLLSALAAVLQGWSGGALLVDLESHGRDHPFEGMDLSRSVGWFTCVYPLRLAAVGESGATLKAVKQMLREVPDGGLGYGVLRYPADPAARAEWEGLPQARIGFNYFGRLDGEAGDFAAAPETVGDDHDPCAPLPYWLEINAQVAGGVLQLRWRYAASQYRRDTILALAEDYRRQLAAILAHCAGTSGVTPSDFPLAGLSQAQLDALPLPTNQVEDLYPLSPMQQGMLFHDVLEPQAGVYLNQMCLDIEGLDGRRFADVWQRALDRHPILRSGFLWRGEAEQALQVVYKRASLPVEILDWRDRIVDAAALAGLAETRRTQGFEHARAPLMRMTLVRLSEQRWHWLWTSHHLLLDGWSTSQLLGEVLDDYVGNARSAPAGGYRDYIAWLSCRDQAAAEAFWRARLAALEQPTLLAAAVAKPARAGQGHASLTRCLDAAFTRDLQAYAQQQRVTLNTLLQAAWALLLSRYCNRDTVALGATVSGRPAELPAVERIVGLFINTLPLVVTIAPQHQVGDWLREIQLGNLAMREHEHTPLYQLQAWAGQAGSALFDSLLVFENFPVDAALKASPAGLSFGAPRHVDTTHYPLTINVSIGDSLGLAYGYWQGSFDADCIERLDRQFCRVLTALAENPQCRLSELNLLDDADRLQLLSGNATATVYPEGLVPEWLSRAAARQPWAPALALGEAELSYAELEARSNRLAHWLIARGVGPETPVGIGALRSFELVLGILAIVKAGGAYLPLDPDYPDQRLAYMAADSGIGMLLSHGAVLDRFAALCPDSCAVYDLDSLDLSAQAESAPVVQLHPAHPAYIIYTSGSTGQPKGAANSHAALANRLHWMQQAYAIGPGDSVLQKTPFSFDVSVWEFFWPLMTGARLVLARPGAHRDPAALAATLQAQQVSTVHFVPSMLAEFVNQAQLPPLPALKRIVCSGEALPAELQQRVFERLPGVDLVNLYGPTEAAIDVTHWTCRAEPGPVPIGRPIANLQIHILDSDLNPLPAGVAGELYIGGLGLARGYYRKPGLTGERFLPDPFGSGGRLYRSGDLARRRADGALDYLGRIDQQIKLRGLRIELGEIETALLQQAGVAEAAVLLQEAAGGTRLVAYIAAGAEAGSDADLRDALSRRLPDYMLPAALIRLDSLPKTANGKLDRKALPHAHWQGQAYRAPHSDSERRLAAIWQELLAVESVGLDDNFFELGGHSLLAMKLVGRIQRDFGVEVPVRQVFESARLSALAGHVDTLTVEARDEPVLQSELADALAELQGLSDEALKALLGDD
ncbi:non-ribosomal peptide synthetase [Methylomonas rhizoryzae]|uniref:non-ribosomal peptide synthetase n=1 Tax=Methylomonas rhizoryzae TaxID=2608981 RepID=UPI0012328C65|nr:non-ribosomal peptide synthetase [Methylomonas rhizoryzae]